MLQMMFEDLPQLNEGSNLSQLLDNDNALDIATTFSVTMAAQQFESELSTANLEGLGYQQNYSGNCVYTRADLRQQTARYQPYSTQQRYDPQMKQQVMYSNYMTPSPRCSAITQPTYTDGSLNQPLAFSINENSNQQWIDQNPSNSFHDQNNRNVNNNNSVVFDNQYQNNHLSTEAHVNQFGCVPQLDCNPYQPQYTHTDHQFQTNQATIQQHCTNIKLMSNMNPSSPLDGTGSKKKRSPEPKKKTKCRRKPRQNEPQKPVSAYALFFRDTQAAIKAENASASFGEISKIVASMWDTLSEEDKQIYKQKTETAKRDYLKQLAMYKANAISMGSSLDGDDEDSQPLSVLKKKMAFWGLPPSPPSPIITPPQQIIDLTESSPDHHFAPPPKLQPSPGIILVKNDSIDSPEENENDNTDATEDSLQKDEEEEIPRPTQIRIESRSPSPTIAYKQIIVSKQKGCQGTITFISKPTTTDAQPTSLTSNAPSTPQMKRIVLTPFSPTVTTVPNTPSPPPPIQLRNIVAKSTMTFIPSKGGQIIKVLPGGKMGTLTIPKVSNVKGNMIQVSINRPISSTSTSTSIPVYSFQKSPPEAGNNKNEEDEIISAQMNEASMEDSPSSEEEPLPTLVVKPEKSCEPVPMETAEDIQPSLPTLPKLKQISKTKIEQTTVPIKTEVVEQPKPMETSPTPDMDRQSPVTIMLTADPVKPQAHKRKIEKASKESSKSSYTPTQQCIRRSCQKTAVSNPEWDNDYCGYECVAKHCKDVMNAWISARQVTASLG